MQLYCTLFDRNYITRGLALHSSLERHCANFRLLILCLDQATLDALALLSLGNAELVSLDALENHDPELRRVRSERTTVEYYFTCKPSLMQFAIEKYPKANRICYLDSDLYYFVNPEILEKDYSESAVALTPHRLPSHLGHFMHHGLFNAGWVNAKVDTEGKRFIAWWRARCIEWCYVKIEPDRFGDQKYLDQVPGLFPNTAVLSHPGANAAPWNLANLNVSLSSAAVNVNEKPLVFFHFHGLKRLLFNYYDSGLYQYEVEFSPPVRKLIYSPYLAEIGRLSAALQTLPAKIQRALRPQETRFDVETSLRRIKRAGQVVVSGTGILASKESR